MGRPILDIKGKRFYRLVAIERANVDSDKHHVFWKCKCDCGNEIIVRKDSLLSGHAKSCGCYLKERYKDGHSKTHGKSKTSLYHKWASMKSRCYSKSCQSYNLYGGRGIKVCDEWLGKNGFENFSLWAYSNGYDEYKTRSEQSIDRIDVDGNYEPSNCRWVNCEVQNYNKRDTVRIRIDGEEKTLKDIEKEYGIPISTLRSRWRKFNEGKYSLEDLLTKGKINKLPPNTVLININGKVQSLSKWEKETGVNHKTIMYRYNKNIRNPEELFKK